jgi:hypothetical protein
VKEYKKNLSKSACGGEIEAERKRKAARFNG